MHPLAGLAIPSTTGGNNMQMGIVLPIAPVIQVAYLGAADIVLGPLPIRLRKRNKKVTIKPWLRRLTGAHHAMALVASFAHWSALLEAGESIHERASTTSHLCSGSAISPPPACHALLCPCLLMATRCTHRCARQGCTETLLLTRKQPYQELGRHTLTNGNDTESSDGSYSG